MSKNTVQAKHHQLIPVEELERALSEGRAIGYNDVACHVAKNVDPYVAPSLANAMKYQTRMGRKDDNRQEIEKAIWYLMDAHNRYSDLEEVDRDFAPWRHMGKLSQVKELQDNWSGLLFADDEVYDQPDLSSDNWLQDALGITYDYDDDDLMVKSLDSDDYYWSCVTRPFNEFGQLSEDKFKVGDTIMFRETQAGTVTFVDEEEYKISRHPDGELTLIGFEHISSFITKREVWKKEKRDT